MRRREILVSAAATALAGPTAWAQDKPWPSRPVRWIVPWGAGGAADALARTVAQKLGERWGQQVIVDNKPGGTTIIAATEAMRAAPDGYTLFMPIAATMTSNQFMYSKLPYDPLRDFTPIAIIAGLPLIVLTKDGAPATTLPELIELAKKKPDTIPFASATGSQLHCEQWMRDWGVKFRYIPYKSGVEVTKALLGGEVEYALDAIPSNLGHLREGKLKGLAVNTDKRVATVPGVPTMEELHIKHTEPKIWHGVVGPAGLPTSLQSRINADLQAVLSMPEINERLSKEMGLEPMLGVGPDEFTKRVRADIAVTGPLIKELGLKAD
jgi:tripartite-type tricarboxylate transporter receptor subunit TctC